jgi:hypothetical protein
MVTRKTETISCDRCDATAEIIDDARRHCLPEGWRKFTWTEAGAGLGDLRYDGGSCDLCPVCSNSAMNRLGRS